MTLESHGSRLPPWAYNGGRRDRLKTSTGRGRYEGSQGGPDQKHIIGLLALALADRPTEGDELIGHGTPPAMSK